MQLAMAAALMSLLIQASLAEATAEAVSQGGAGGIAIQSTGELGLVSPAQAAAASAAPPGAALLYPHLAPYIPWYHHITHPHYNTPLVAPQHAPIAFPQQYHHFMNSLLQQQHQHEQHPHLHLPSYAHLIANNPYQMLGHEQQQHLQRQNPHLHGTGQHLLPDEVPFSERYREGYIDLPPTQTPPTQARRPRTTPRRKPYYDQDNHQHNGEPRSQRTTTSKPKEPEHRVVKTLPPFRTFQGKNPRSRTYKSLSRRRMTTAKTRTQRAKSILAPPPEKHTSPPRRRGRSRNTKTTTTELGFISTTPHSIGKVTPLRYRYTDSFRNASNYSPTTPAYHRELSYQHLDSALQSEPSHYERIHTETNNIQVNNNEHQEPNYNENFFHQQINSQEVYPSNVPFGFFPHLVPPPPYKHEAIPVHRYQDPYHHTRQEQLQSTGKTLGHQNDQHTVSYEPSNYEDVHGLPYFEDAFPEYRTGEDYEKSTIFENLDNYEKSQAVRDRQHRQYKRLDKSQESYSRKPEKEAQSSGKSDIATPPPSFFPDRSKYKPKEKKKERFPVPEFIKSSKSNHFQEQADLNSSPPHIYDHSYDEYEQNPADELHLKSIQELTPNLPNFFRPIDDYNIQDIHFERDYNDGNNLGAIPLKYEDPYFDQQLHFNNTSRPIYFEYSPNNLFTSSELFGNYHSNHPRIHPTEPSHVPPPWVSFTKIETRPLEFQSPTHRPTRYSTSATAKQLVPQPMYSHEVEQQEQDGINETDLENFRRNKLRRRRPLWLRLARQRAYHSPVLK